MKFGINKAYYYRYTYLVDNRPNGSQHMRQLKAIGLRTPHDARG